MKLSEIISDFLIAKEIEEGCSKNTSKAYEYDLLMLKDHIGDMAVERIKSFHIRRFLKILYQKDYTKKSIARKIACFKSFFRFLFENDLIEKNPMKSIKSPKISQEEQLPKYLSHGEIKDVLDLIKKGNDLSYYVQKRLKVIIPLLYSSMARVSEICSLKIGDVDLDRNFIKVRGKGNKERYIPIDFHTKKILEEYIENRRLECLGDSDAPLFINAHHNPLNARTVQRDVKKLKKALGWGRSKKLTPHIFRHTGATHLRQNGMDISELQDLLGHSNPNTTRIYAKNDIKTLKNSFNKYHPLAQNPNTSE